MTNIPESNVTQTQTQTVTESETESREQTPQRVLHLRKPKNKPRVRWTEETVDNEHMNKKKTKICCIFHPQQDFDHECSESSSSDDSESDASGDEGNGDNRPSSPNAYEHQPKYNKS